MEELSCQISDACGCSLTDQVTPEQSFGLMGSPEPLPVSPSILRVLFLSSILYISFSLKVFKSLDKSCSALRRSRTAAEAQRYPRAVQTVAEGSSAQIHVRGAALSGASGVKLDRCDELDRVAPWVALNIKNKSKFEAEGLLVASSCLWGSVSPAACAGAGH